MRLTILMAGAAALGPVLGIAVSGSINTVPKQPAANVLALLDSIPRHEEAPFSAQQSASLPDHYPLVTPRGTIQVADLWLHGLYHDRHPAMAPDLYEFDVPPAELRPLEELDAPQGTPPSSEGKITAGEAPVNQSVASHETPATASAPGPLLVPHDVQPPQTGPKVVDVAAVLAGR